MDSMAGRLGARADFANIGVLEEMPVSSLRRWHKWLEAAIKSEKEAMA